MDLPQYSHTSHIAREEEAMDLLQSTVTLRGSSGLWISHPHFWAIVGSGSPSVHSHTAREQWATDHFLH